MELLTSDFVTLAAHFAAVFALICYLIVSILSLWGFWRSSQSVSKIARLVFLAAFCGHTVALIALSLGTQYWVLKNGADAYFFASWICSVSYLVVSRRIHYPVIAAVFLPAVTLLIASSSYLLHAPVASALNQRLDSSNRLLLVLLHAVPAVIAISGMTLAFVMSSAFVIVEQKIKAKSKSLLDARLPSLSLLESWSNYFTIVGFIAVTLLILSGVVWSFSSNQRLIFDPSVVLTLLVWGLLAFLVLMRSLSKLSERKLAYLTAISTGIFFIVTYCLLFLTGSLSHGVLS